MNDVFCTIGRIMSKPLSDMDWQHIYDATRERLLATEFNSEDTRSNRVICEMIVSNILYDICDHYKKIKDTL